MSDIPARENTNIALFCCFPTTERIHLQHVTKTYHRPFSYENINLRCLSGAASRSRYMQGPTGTHLPRDRKGDDHQTIRHVDGAFQPFHHALREFTLTPGSESAAIIASLERQRKGRATEHARDDGEIRYVTDEIETLAEIVSLPGLCGRYCLIDLWASWCIPCRQQFRFTEQLHEITARYDSLQLVYISIDKPETADRWTKAVEKHALAGWHIRAGQSLLEDITQKVYQNRNITIPRYILLAPSGEIVCPDLPRPNRYEALAAALASCLEDEGQ